MIRINGNDYDSTILDSSTPGTPIGTYHLANNPNIYEIQRTNNFELVISDIDGILKAGVTDAAGASYANAQEVIRMSVISFPIPHFTQNVLEVKRGNTTLKYAGVPTFDNGRLVCYDYIGAETAGVLEAWQNLSYNVNTEKVGLASDYKKDCTVIEYSPDYQPVRTWKLRGCWISGLQEEELNNENNAVMKVTATITYDRAEIDMSGIE